MGKREGTPALLAGRECRSTDLIIQEKPETQVLLSNEFFNDFQMLATNSKILKHRGPKETYFRGKSSPLAAHLGILVKWDEGT